jgi:hypothetical protein
MRECPSDGFFTPARVDDKKPIFVTDDTPAAESRYRARFYFDPNSIPMAKHAHRILEGRNGADAVVVRVLFRWNGSQGVYQISADLAQDGTSSSSIAWFTISDAPHFMEIDWRASSAAGANDGGLTLWSTASSRQT